MQEKVCSRKMINNGQPPSRAVHENGSNVTKNASLSTSTSISRGASDPSLAIQQPVPTSHLHLQQQEKKKKKEKSSAKLEFYHWQAAGGSGDYQARRQGDRPSVNASRSSSAADLSRSYSSVATLGSNNSSSLNNIQVST